MRNNLQTTVSQFHTDRKRSNRKKILVGLLSLVVAVSTLFSLLMPAFTLEKETFCGREEHVHTEDCYAMVPVPDSEGEEPNEDTDEVKDAGEETETGASAEVRYEKILVCGLEEHTHDISCYSDPGAVESESDWTSGLPRSGNTAQERLLKIAASQLGYRESTQNYIVAGDGSLKGYTRYGDWYGDPYGDWDAMFLSFCLYYAGIGQDSLPYESDSAHWAQSLSAYGKYGVAGDYLPKDGDLVFFDTDLDNLADRCGLVSSADPDTELLKVIEGDFADSVEMRSFLLSDGSILGYGVLPEELCAAEPEAPDNEEDPSDQDPAAERTASRNTDHPAQSFSEELDGLSVCVEADEGAFPADTVMEARLVSSKQVLDAVGDVLNGEVVWVQAVDICFYDQARNELQPLIPIRVSIRSDQITGQEANATEVVHIDAEGAAQRVEQSDDGTEDEVVFETDSFSIYALVGMSIEKTVLASDGLNYNVTVSFGEDAGVPADAELEVTELLPGPDAEDYENYAAKAAQALGKDEESTGSVRLFDIRIVDGSGEKVTITAPVQVEITLTDLEENEDTDLRVIHFADETKKGDVIPEVDVSESVGRQPGMKLSFSADGFSVYAIIEDPVTPATIEMEWVHDLTELAANLTQGFSFSYYDTDNGVEMFSTNVLNGNDAFIETASPSAAAVWYIEPAGTGSYYITTDIGGEHKYLTNPSGNLAGLGNQSAAAVFTITQAVDGRFYFKLQNKSLWLQHSGSGSGMRFWTDNKNTGNSRIRISYGSSLHPDLDPYGLNGKTYGIARYDESTTSTALMGTSVTVSGQQRLKGLHLLMKPDVLDNDGILLVAEDSDIQAWSFECVRGDEYYITTWEGGFKKYLSIDSSGNVTLRTTPDPIDSVIQVIPGTGENTGKWRFTANGRSLNLPTTAQNGFNGVAGSGATTWMNFVERSTLSEDDFVVYTAKKVSVSDTVNVYNGQQVILYTRIWNDVKKRYEFFAVNHDGVLIPCYDAGDTIEWIGSNINTAIWRFTEYTYSDGTPNYYYELENTQYGEYIAPQVTGEQSLSDHTIGINLNGRRYGESCSTIIAWDDLEYSYSGLKTENGHIAPCALPDAEDFYFAVLHPVDPNDQLSTVATIDSNQYGIEMKMIDFNGEIVDSNRESNQKAFFSGDWDNLQTGLLSTNLGPDGYPTGTDLIPKSGHSLAELFNNMTPVNHLFIESTHNESGYFEYDSTSNFAHLESNGNFTVYDQLGAITGDSERKNTRTHGQFMPYDRLWHGRESDHEPDGRAEKRTVRCEPAQGRTAVRPRHDETGRLLLRHGDDRQLYPDRQRPGRLGTRYHLRVLRRRRLLVLCGRGTGPGSGRRP